MNAVSDTRQLVPLYLWERVNRKAAYEATGEAVTKWQPIVKANREKPTLKFTDQERDKMQRKETIAAMNADFQPANDFEKEIMAKLKEAGMATGKDVERGEDLAGGFRLFTRHVFAQLKGLNEGNT